MPNVSGSTTQASTYFPDLPAAGGASAVAIAESTDVTALQNGDEAYIAAATPALYRLDKTSTTARNGTTVLYTRNSNPTYLGAPAGATPGRWVTPP